MKSWRSQRGDVPVGCLVSGAVLLIIVLIAIKVTPVVVNVGTLDTKISVLADRANRREYNDKRILSEILNEAKSIDLPVTKKNVKIKRTSNRIKITVIYTIPIEFPGYTFMWRKEHFEDRPLFYG